MVFYFSGSILKILLAGFCLNETAIAEVFRQLIWLYLKICVTQFPIANYCYCIAVAHAVRSRSMVA